MLIFDDSEDQDYAQHLNWQLNENENFPTKSAPINELKQIKEIARKQEVDIIFVATPDSVNEDLFKEIVKLRNDKEVKKQPIIFVMKSEKNKDEMEKIQKYAADIIELPPYVDLTKLPKQIKSVPELL
ncbi:hypothetical protein KKH38_03075 [Patescibacteria group bacterium]|nr:hypothetical protein [Patescibacteria group bacterium]MBU4601082.1 hypothetical protein [Patescibacteria group bacterium]MCG2698200.1 hypothetical protein [Candidatus Parcubacteria bacterium]